MHGSGRQRWSADEFFPALETIPCPAQAIAANTPAALAVTVHVAARITTSTAKRRTASRSAWMARRFRCPHLARRVARSPSRSARLPAGQHEARYTLTLYYCPEGNEAACAIRSLQWQIPLVVNGADGTARISAHRDTGSTRVTGNYYEAKRDGGRRDRFPGGLLLYTARSRTDACRGRDGSEGATGAMTTHLYLIRHGEAITNVEPIIGGMRGDTGLSPLGVRQAEALRDRLAATQEIAADLLIASTFLAPGRRRRLSRPRSACRSSGRRMCRRCASARRTACVWTNSRERYGVPDFARDPYRPLAPGGESWAQFLLRVGTTLNRIADAHDGKTDRRSSATGDH